MYVAGPTPTTGVPQDPVQIQAVLEESRSRKQPPAVPVCGPELAALMKIGTRVVRGADWKWNDQVRSPVWD